MDSTLPSFQNEFKHQENNTILILNYVCVKHFIYHGKRKKSYAIRKMKRG